MGVEATWPRIEDLIEGSTIEIPEALQKDLSQRYAERGGKYATEEIDEESGLHINSCMQRDNIQEMYEEIVDAVFNVLVYLKRFPERKLAASHLLSLLLKTVEISNQEASHANVSGEDVGDSVPPAAEGSGEQSGSRGNGTG